MYYYEDEKITGDYDPMSAFKEKYDSLNYNDNDFSANYIAVNYKAPTVGANRYEQWDNAR